MRNTVFRYKKYLQYCDYKRFKQILRDYNSLDSFIISIINTTVKNTRANKNGYGVQVDYLTIYKESLWRKTPLSKWHLTYSVKK